MEYSNCTSCNRRKKANELTAGEEVRLVQGGVTYGVLTVGDIYVPDKQKGSGKMYTAQQTLRIQA
ncbi:hypothetical protein GCM10020331_068910 [Ectobacillus funiculus]